MRGSISIVLALTIMLLFSFPLVLIESVREETMLLQSYVALDNATQSTLAEYQESIWESYDILAIDYGFDESENVLGGVGERLKRYASYNIGGDLVNTIMLRDDWLYLSVEDVSIDNPVFLSDQQGYGAYKAMIEAQKRITGIAYLEELMEWKEVVEVQFHKADLQHRKEEVTESFANYFEELIRQEMNSDKKNEKNEETKETGIVPLENPLDVSDKWTLSMMLQYLLGKSYDENNFGNIPLDPIAIDGEIRWNTYQDFSITDSVMFVQYLFEHMDYYNKSLENDLYEVEYVLYGKESNYRNIEAAIEEIVALREIDNYLCIIQDSIAVSQIESISAALTTLAQVPYMEPVLTQAIILSWAYIESISDVKTLLEGGRVPLTKSITALVTSVESVFSELEITTQNNILDGLNYEEYLMLFCFLKAPEELTIRALDIMEFHVRVGGNRDKFDIENCLLSYDAHIKFKDVFNKTYDVEKSVFYD